MSNIQQDMRGSSMTDLTIPQSEYIKFYQPYVENWLKKNIELNAQSVEKTEDIFLNYLNYHIQEEYEVIPLKRKFLITILKKILRNQIGHGRVRFTYRQGAQINGLKIKK